LKDTLPNYATEKFSEWVSFKEKVLSSRSLLQRLLLDANGCFQGTGKKCYGVDIVKILSDYPDAVTDIVYEDFLELDANTKVILQGLHTQRVEARIKGVSTEARKTIDAIESEFGTEFDRKEIAEALKSVANNLKQMGRFNSPTLGFTFNEFSTLCDEFKDSAIKDTLLLFTKFNNEDSTESKKISNFGRIQLAPLSICDRFISYSLKLILAVENEVKILDQQLKGLNKVEKIDAINLAFKDLSENLSAIQKDTSHGNA
jgi:hypothetical protein